MGISSVVSSLVLGASLTFASFEQNIETTVTHEQTVFSTINQEQHNAKRIIELLQELQSSSEIFNREVIAYINTNRDTWLKEDSKKLGQNLSKIALHLKEKLSFYKGLKKTPLKKNKQAKEILITLEKITKTIQMNVQENIDYAYLYIDAKQTFALLQSVSEVVLDTFWFSEDDITDERTLFIVSSVLNPDDLEKIYEIEDQLTKILQTIAEHKQTVLAELELPKVDVFDFNAISKQHFSRVSFL